MGSLEASKFGVSSITAGLSLLSTCNASTDLWLSEVTLSVEFEKKLFLKNFKIIIIGKTARVYIKSTTCTS